MDAGSSRDTLSRKDLEGLLASEAPSFIGEMQYVGRLG